MSNIPEGFKEFALDHIKYFNAVPNEFEDEKGNVFGAASCWEFATILGLQSELKTND